LSNQTSCDTNRKTPCQFQINLLETTYVNTCNIIVTNTRLTSILFRLHTVSSRLLQNLWHSNGPEPKVHFFVLESKSRLSPVSCPWCLYQMCCSVISTLQWPNTQIICFLQKRKSAWHGAMSTPVDMEQFNWRIWKHFFLEGGMQQKNRQDPPKVLFPTRYYFNAFKISGGKKTSLINSTIWGQKFSGVVFFTV